MTKPVSKTSSKLHRVITPLLDQGHHLSSRAKSNAVAYLPGPERQRRGKGRPRVHGEPVRLKGLAKDERAFASAPSPVYAENNVPLRYRVLRANHVHVQLGGIAQGLVQHLAIKHTRKSGVDFGVG